MFASVILIRADVDPDPKHYLLQSVLLMKHICVGLQLEFFIKWDIFSKQKCWISFNELKSRRVA